MARRPAPSGSALVGEVWSFNPRPMAQKLGECVEWVTARMTAAELAGIQGEVDPLTVEEGLFPPGLSPLETVALLRTPEPERNDDDGGFDEVLAAVAQVRAAVTISADPPFGNPS